jgi:putative ABC transport system substrate-binding protein
MRRRDLIKAIAGSAAVWPLATHAQESIKIWRIGFLAGGPRPVSLESSVFSGFLRGMREVGYVQSRDFTIEWRFAEGRIELLPVLAAELVRLNVDVIVLGTSAAVHPTKRATTTIPIVMGASSDPVANGYVVSLGRPGGNVTGLTNSEQDTFPKRLELLAMVVPNLARVGFPMNPEDSRHVSGLESAQAVAQRVGIVLVPVKMRNSEEVSNGFAALGSERVGAVMFPPNAFFFSQRQRIAELALKARFPTMFVQREYVEAGGLMNYGEGLADFYRRAAFYVDKIFKGAKPADLPVEQPTRFFLVVNRRTADTIGLSLPLEVLVRADEVIE